MVVRGCSFDKHLTSGRQLQVYIDFLCVTAFVLTANAFCRHVALFSVMEKIFEIRIVNGLLSLFSRSIANSVESPSNGTASNEYPPLTETMIKSLEKFFL